MEAEPWVHLSYVDGDDEVTVVQELATGSGIPSLCVVVGPLGIINTLPKVYMTVSSASEVGVSASGVVV